MGLITGCCGLMLAKIAWAGKTGGGPSTQEAGERSCPGPCSGQAHDFHGASVVIKAERKLDLSRARGSTRRSVSGAGFAGAGLGGLGWLEGDLVAEPGELGDELVLVAFGVDRK